MQVREKCCSMFRLVCLSPGVNPFSIIFLISPCEPLVSSPGDTSKLLDSILLYCTVYCTENKFLLHQYFERKFFFNNLGKTQ